MEVGGVVSGIRCALLLALCSSCAHPSPRVASAPFAPILTTRAVTDAGYHAETSIAVSPTRPATVVASYEMPATVARSEDAGAHWSTAPLPGVEEFQLSGDPSVLFDADGHVYALYIAFDRPDDYDTLARAAHRNGVFVNRSDDGGATWQRRATPVIYHREELGIPFEDKPMMAVDRSDEPSRRGNLYVAWTEFRQEESVILFSRSTDGGASFSAPVEVSDRAGSPKDSTGANEGTDVAVAPDGAVYVVWSDSAGIRLDRSTDGGRTFGEDQLVARATDIIFGVPSVLRANGFPSLEIDPRSGRAYVAWVDRRLGVATPFIVSSSDGGASWSEPLAVASPTAADSVNRFFAWLSVDPVTGTVALSYYRERDAGAIEYELAYSTDDGRHFTQRTWSNRPFAPLGVFLGDYTGVAAYDGVAYGAWTEIVPPDPSHTQARREIGPRSRIAVGRAQLTPPPR